jgi:hypothetical protein
MSDAAITRPITPLLDDLDLGNRRLTIASRTRPIDEFSHQILLEWLDYRHTRWPNTANTSSCPHSASTAQHRTDLRDLLIVVSCGNSPRTPDLGVLRRGNRAVPK